MRYREAARTNFPIYQYTSLPIYQPMLNLLESVRVYKLELTHLEGR